MCLKALLHFIPIEFKRSTDSKFKALVVIKSDGLSHKRHLGVLLGPAYVENKETSCSYLK